MTCESLLGRSKWLEQSSLQQPRPLMTSYRAGLNEVREPLLMRLGYSWVKIKEGGNENAQ